MGWWTSPFQILLISTFYRGRTSFFWWRWEVIDGGWQLVIIMWQCFEFCRWSIRNKVCLTRKGETKHFQYWCMLYYRRTRAKIYNPCFKRSMAIVRINAHFCNKIEKMYLAYVATYLNHTRLFSKEPRSFSTNQQSWMKKKILRKAKGSQLLVMHVHL